MKALKGIKLYKFISEQQNLIAHSSKVDLDVNRMAFINYINGEYKQDTIEGASEVRGNFKKL